MTTKFFKCTICGNVIVKLVDSGVKTVCCGKEMVELQPGTTDGKVEYHVPVAERLQNSTIRILVGKQPHPMTNEHHIDFIYIETENGGNYVSLDPTGKAQVEVCDCSEKIVAIYAYCNLHGLWKTDFKDESENTGEDKEISSDKDCHKDRCYCGWFAMLLMSIFSISCTAQKVDNSTVESLDIERYLGKWFELARYDHRFERGVYYPTAEYSLMNNGKIRVINRGMKEGQVTMSVGKAKTTDTEGVLRVSFFGPFYSDYRIMMLDEEYQYALVGSASDKYLWILSRTPQIDGKVKHDILTEACLRGYNTAKLLWMEQKPQDK